MVQHARLLEIVLLLLHARIARSLAPAAVGSRVSARNNLLELLPPGPPSVVDARMSRLLSELEVTGATPATPLFLTLGISGTWSLRAIGLSSPDEPPADGPHEQEVKLLSAEQHVWADGRMLSLASFEVDDGCERLAGTLEVDSQYSLVPSLSDSLLLKGAGMRLRLPRPPRQVPLPQMMTALHASLSSEFSLSEGDEFSLRLQTTYLDDQLRVTRCALANFRQAVAVHVRTGDPRAEDVLACYT